MRWGIGMQNQRRQAILNPATGLWYFISEMENYMSTENIMTHTGRQWLPKDEIDSLNLKIPWVNPMQRNLEARQRISRTKRYQIFILKNGRRIPTDSPTLLNTIKLICICKMAGRRINQSSVCSLTQLQFQPTDNAKL